MYRNSPLCPTGHRPFGAAAQKGYWDKDWEIEKKKGNWDDYRDLENKWNRNKDRDIEKKQIERRKKHKGLSKLPKSEK